jgi:hypothetical protein
MPRNQARCLGLTAGAFSLMLLNYSIGTSAFMEKQCIFLSDLFQCCKKISVCMFHFLLHYFITINRNIIVNHMEGHLIWSQYYNIGRALSTFVLILCCYLYFICSSLEKAMTHSDYSFRGQKMQLWIFLHINSFVQTDNDSFSFLYDNKFVWIHQSD